MRVHLHVCCKRRYSYPPADMVECLINSEQLIRAHKRNTGRMSGTDVKQHDRFSNASLLSILTRSYSKRTPVTTNSSSAGSASSSVHGNINSNSNIKISPKGNRSGQGFLRKENEKVPTLLSRFSITSSSASQSAAKGLATRISRGVGANVYVRQHMIL